jgi:hypothetical protein
MYRLKRASVAPFGSCTDSQTQIKTRLTRNVSDPDSRAKMTHKSRKNLEISCFDVLDVLF